MFRIFAALIGLVAAGSLNATVFGTFPETTGIIASDINGQTWNIDSLLSAGKHVWVHQTWGG